MGTNYEKAKLLGPTWDQLADMCANPDCSYVAFQLSTWSVIECSRCCEHFCFKCVRDMSENSFESYCFDCMSKLRGISYAEWRFDPI